MQKMPFRSESNHSSSTPAAVNVVTHHWVSDRRKMNANLMSSPGVQMRTQQVSRSKAGETDKVRFRLPAVIDDCHALSVSRISRERFFDGQLVPLDVTPDHNRVPSGYATGRDRRRENPVSTLCFGDEQKTRSLLVEPMNDSCAIGCCTGRELASAAHQRVDECSRPVTRRGMNHHSRRLVYDEQVFILVNDRDRYRFAGDLTSSDSRLVDDDHVACHWTIAGFFAAAVDRDISIRDQCCSLSSRKLGA